ncbi:MAG: AAA family ATPase [Micromonosporaceae bacterium]|nr:AAA family ATPase [Micromonosporaceae bacterium]
MISGWGSDRARAVSPALVGRDRELAALASTVAAPPTIVSIEGEAGVGKTRLVSELPGRPELAGRRLLVGRCHQIRESFPLGPVVEAVRGVGAAELPGLRLSPVVGALRPLLPELAGLLPAAPPPPARHAAGAHADRATAPDRHTGDSGPPWRWSRPAAPARRRTLPRRAPQTRAGPARSARSDW